MATHELTHCRFLISRLQNYPQMFHKRWTPPLQQATIRPQKATVHPQQPTIHLQQASTIRFQQATIKLQQAATIPFQQATIKLQTQKQHAPIIEHQPRSTVGAEGFTFSYYYVNGIGLKVVFDSCFLPRCRSPSCFALQDISIFIRNHSMSNYCLQ